MFCFSKTNSAKDELLLKHFINKTVWKKTSNFSYLLFVFHKNVFLFLMTMFERTYCNIKMLLRKKQPSRNPVWNNVCFCNFPWGRPNNSSKVTFRSSHAEFSYEKDVYVQEKSEKINCAGVFLNKCQTGGL